MDFEKTYVSLSWRGSWGTCLGVLSFVLDGGIGGEHVFSWSMLVLVNGCPTEQVQISKGLKQGDLLAPYLFVLVVEGMGALMKKAVGLGYLRGSRLRIRKKSYLIFGMWMTHFSKNKLNFLL